MPRSRLFRRTGRGPITTDAATVTFARMEFTGAGGRALLAACYLPPHVWGPLLLALVWAHYRRRCRD